MLNPRLYLDSDGDVHLQWEEPLDRHHARVLGAPRDELYDEVPSALWPLLEAMIDAAIEARRYGRECRGTAEDAYWRGRT